MLLGLQDVGFEFGAKTILSAATWHIHPGERIGLIGYNGAGKSTILKLLTGNYTPQRGSVEKSKETTIGYLHQDLLSYESNESIIEVAKSAFEKAHQIQTEIDKLQDLIEKNPEDEALLIAYSNLLHEFELAGGYTVEAKTEEVLQGLGFKNEDLRKLYKTLSGGWRMRVLLARMILQSPDILLLDEPTNHLDLPSIEWLEKYLLHYPGSVVIVSHDKYFLDKMVTKIVEIFQEQLHIYSGNYSFYEKEKELRLTLQKKAFENQQDYIRQQERFVERFKAKASKATQAQSILKKLEKLDIIEDISIERPSMKINFKIDRQPGKIIHELKNIDKSFGAQVILRQAEALIERGDKIALIGANGKGKSTLLRIVAGTESFVGEGKEGHQVYPSFYAQHQLEALNLEHTLLEEMNLHCPQKTELEIRSLLGGFLFSGDDIHKKIKVLSGGEKARVALAKVIASTSNFLLLDEPTNHLDMHSVELLAAALNKYEGSLLLVSHDRYFISQVANVIWEIVDGKIKVFKGAYTEWVDWQERQAKQNKPIEERPEKPPKKNSKPEIEQINNYAENERKKLQKENAQIETKLNLLQKNIAELELQLTDNSLYTDNTKFQTIEQNYQAKLQEKENLERQYETIFEKMIALEAQG